MFLNQKLKNDLINDSEEINLKLKKTKNDSKSGLQWSTGKGLEYLHASQEPCYNPYQLNIIEFADRGHFYFVKSSRGVLMHLKSECLFIPKPKFLQEKAQFESLITLKLFSHLKAARALAILKEHTRYMKKFKSKSAIEQCLKFSYLKFIINIIPEFAAQGTSQTLHNQIIDTTSAVEKGILLVKEKLEALVASESEIPSRWLLSNYTIQKLVRLVEYILIQHCTEFITKQFKRIGKIQFKVVHESDLNLHVIQTAYSQLDISFDVFDLDNSDKLFGHTGLMKECLLENMFLDSQLKEFMANIIKARTLILSEKQKCLTYLYDFENNPTNWSQFSNIKVGHLEIQIQPFLQQWIRDYIVLHPNLQNILINSI